MEPKFKIGDEVICKKHYFEYYNKHLKIIDVGHYWNYKGDLTYSYCCEVLKNLDNKNTIIWLNESELQPTKKLQKEYFTISLKKHKRINLKFTL
jgi:hypothetical protein|nr:MAG TPA: hypothetical protein [Bacteriophage sp.]